MFRVDCDPLRTKARPARLVAVLAEVRDSLAFPFRQSGVIGFFGRCVASSRLASGCWSMQMVAVKGTQTLAQKYNYIGDLHRREHHLPPHAVPVDED